MRSFKNVSFLMLALLLTSCYHAQIITDAQPSSQVIDEPWAHSFIFGLVPPKEIRTASECPNGVAKVETQISFLNGLVSAITFNLYTPMHITVTCAAGSGMSVMEESSNTKLTLSKEAGDEEVINVIKRASEITAETKKPVYVAFE